MKILEIIPDFLSMYGVFTQNTSQIRQEISIMMHNTHTFQLLYKLKLFIRVFFFIFIFFLFFFYFFFLIFAQNIDRGTC